jgi:hypothetical protein
VFINQIKEIFMKTTKFIPATVASLVAVFGLAHPEMGWAKSARDTIKGWVEESSDAIKKGIDQCGDDLNAIQDYLNYYHWKGVLEDEATSGPVTLKHLELNDHSKAVVVKPGEKIDAEVKCILDPEHCSIFGLYRIVVGIKGEGPQVVIGHESGLIARKSWETFTLRAPDKPGLYQIRFKPVDAYLKSTALQAWKDEDGNEPDGTTTIGIIVVK